MSTKEIQKKETGGDRFVMLIQQTAGTQVALTSAQRRLGFNYFIAIDMALKKAEEDRQSKKKDLPAIIWKNVKTNILANKINQLLKIGLDPLLENQVHFVPFFDAKEQKWDLSPLLGYNGLQIKALKYGVEEEIPDDIIYEVIHENDIFIPHKKDMNHNYETYEYEIPEPMNRGEIIGGFYYKVFADKTKNKLRWFTVSDIEKRKPKYASEQFWGTWREEMVLKTLKRAAWSSIPIDSKKIDDAYVEMVKQDNELQQAYNELQEDYNENAGTTSIIVEEEPPASQPDIPEQTAEDNDVKAAEQPKIEF